MAKKYFLIIDMQNDFCTGALKNDSAVKIIPFIKEKIKEFRADGTAIVYTRDTHGAQYRDSLEGKHLPVPHCIKDSIGWQIVPELAPQEGDIIVDKPVFGYSGWQQVIADAEEVYMAGTCTDICVISNALAIKASLPSTEVFVFKDGCAGLTPEKHNAALDVMASCQCVIL
ncbi:MAG: cysteine hydrolase [Elusimicrobiales bacterium]|nr:cysteine hydrolase [Elusimicrobiales bacterium]